MAHAPKLTLTLTPALIALIACTPSESPNDDDVGMSETAETDDETIGDGDGDESTDDSTTGDGDGDETTGDGDGDETTGDGDGDGDETSEDSTTGGDLPLPAVLELSFSPVKQFDFTWAPVEGAEYHQLLERAAPGEDFVQVGDDILEGSVSLTVPLYARATASYILRSCNEFGCTDSEPVDVVGSLAEAVGYFKASNTDSDDYFGTSVALSGDGSTLAVGASKEDGGASGIGGDQADNSASDSGAVYVFTRDAAGEWSQQAYIKASNAEALDRFGVSVALSDDGDSLAVGAVWERSGATGVGGNQADNSADNSGAVYVFTRDDLDAWSQQAYIKASNTDVWDLFGINVELSANGNTLAVTAGGEDGGATGINGDQTNNDMNESGAVYVFVRNGTAWSQQAYIKASNTDFSDDFGSGMALSDDGNTLAVGAPFENSLATGVGGNQGDNGNTGDSPGAAYVFVRDGNEWSQQAYIKASNTGHSDQFGLNLALSGDGNTLAVGAPFEDSNATGIDGNQASEAASSSGAVYVFVREGDAWSQQAYVKASNPNQGDEFGQGIALSDDGSTLVVGAPYEDSSASGIDGEQLDNSTKGAGAIYTYVRDDIDGWSQQAFVKASNPDVFDVFGSNVELAGDGSTLAVGVSWESSGATGIGGDQADNSTLDAGAVYLY